MDFTVCNREALVFALEVAMTLEEDSFIFAEGPGTTILINGLDDVRLCRAALEKSNPTIRRLRSGNNFNGWSDSDKREYKRLELRLKNPQKIVNKFKKSAAALWRSTARGT